MPPHGGGMEIKMQFKELTLNDKAAVCDILKRDSQYGADYLFGSMFLWQKAYGVKYAFEGGCLISRHKRGNGLSMHYPYGEPGSRAALAKRIIAENDGVMKFYGVSDETLDEIKREFSDYSVEAVEDRDSFYYIYLSERLASLSGKKLHSKRNHISAFKKSGEWSYERITAENRADCLNMYYKWIESNGGGSGLFDENYVIELAFRHYDELGLEGGLLRLNGEIVAFSVGEPINSEIYDVHFEKAYPDVRGAYPMINQQFVLDRCMNYKYVNREEDTGDEGLRKSKLSYYPDILYKQYSVTVSENS